jgi:hypothetical protein
MILNICKNMIILEEELGLVYKIEFPNGKVYKGNFKNNKPDGNGKHFYKGKWIVENVKPYYEPLIKPTKVFGRHLVWSNLDLTDFETQNIPNFIKGDSPATYCYGRIHWAC